MAGENGAPQPPEPDPGDEELLEPVSVALNRDQAIHVLISSFMMAVELDARMQSATGDDEYEVAARLLVNNSGVIMAVKAALGADDDMMERIFRAGSRFRTSTRERAVVEHLQSGGGLISAS